jgi:hypothetical protein
MTDDQRPEPKGPLTEEQKKERLDRFGWDIDDLVIEPPPEEDLSLPQD